MTSKPRMISAWAAILGVAALALGSVHPPIEPTEASWTASEYAEAELRYETPESQEPQEPEESEAPENPDESGEPEDPSDSEGSEGSDEDGSDDDASDGESPPEEEPETEGPQSVEYNLTSVRHYSRALDFCLDFTLTNNTAEAVEWEHRFDTSQAPFWGWTPYDSTGAPQFATHGDPALGAWIGDYEASTSTWTLRGQDFEAIGQGWRGDTRTLRAGESRALSFCTTGEPVPYPAVDPALFSWDLDVANRGWGLTVGLTVETEFESYIPWEIPLNLSEIICPEALEEATLVWQDGYERLPDDVSQPFSYGLRQGVWGDLIKSDVSTQRQIVQITFSDNREIADHMQPNC